jgi:hypothetical protein
MAILSPTASRINSRIATVWNCDKTGKCRYQLELATRDLDGQLRFDRIGPAFPTPEHVRDYAGSNGFPVPSHRSVASLAHV